MLCQRGEKGAQGASLLRVERGGKPSFMLARKFGKLAHQPFPGSGEVEGVQAAVVRIAGALDITTGFELVDIDDHPAGQHAQLLAEGLLAAAGLICYCAQNSRVGWAQVDGGNRFGEQRRGVMAELSQQEGHAVGAVA